jgi:hypothetical protein
MQACVWTCVRVVTSTTPSAAAKSGDRSFSPRPDERGPRTLAVCGRVPPAPGASLAVLLFDGLLDAGHFGHGLLEGDDVRRTRPHRDGVRASPAPSGDGAARLVLLA